MRKYKIIRLVNLTYTSNSGQCSQSQPVLLGRVVDSCNVILVWRPTFLQDTTSQAVPDNAGVEPTHQWYHLMPETRSIKPCQ